MDPGLLPQVNKIRRQQASLALARQRGSLAIESALGLSLLTLLLIGAGGLALDAIMIQADQRALSSTLRLKAQAHADQDDPRYRIFEFEDHRYGFVNRSKASTNGNSGSSALAARALWLKDE